MMRVITLKQRKSFNMRYEESEVDRGVGTLLFVILRRQLSLLYASVCLMRQPNDVLNQWARRPAQTQQSGLVRRSDVSEVAASVSLFVRDRIAGPGGACTGSPTINRKDVWSNSAQELRPKFEYHAVLYSVPPVQEAKHLQVYIGQDSTAME